MQMTTTEQWYWVVNHPSLNPIKDPALAREPRIDVIPMDVNPATGEWDDDHSKNTKSIIAFEIGVYEKYDDVKHGPVNVWQSDTVMCHYYKLDCGGDTWPEAVQALFDIVQNEYGDYVESEV